MALLVVMPSTADLADGWRTPIIALELARTPTDLVFLADPAVREAIAWGQVLDRVFPLAYGGALVAVGARQGLRSVVGLAALAVLADLAENAVIEVLLETWQEPGALLAALAVTTWTKWGALALAFGGIAVAARTERPWLAGLLVLCAVPMPVALLTGWPGAGEGMALGVTVGFLGAMSLAVRA